MEVAARVLGVNRPLFEAGITMEGGVGKVLAATLTENEKEQIFWRNMQGILDRGA